MPGLRHAGRSPTSVTSWPRSRSARPSARAWASDPPTVERSFFAMTTRTRGEPRRALRREWRAGCRPLARTRLRCGPSRAPSPSARAAAPPRRGPPLGRRGALDVDDTLVRVARELVEEARVEARDPDKHEARVGMTPQDALRRVEHVDVPLVALLPADVEHERCALGDPVRRPERAPAARASRVRSHTRRDDARRLDS